jgi:hypothetical protein
MNSGHKFHMLVQRNLCTTCGTDVCEARRYQNKNGLEYVNCVPEKNLRKILIKTNEKLDQVILEKNAAEANTTRLHCLAS